MQNSDRIQSNLHKPKRIQLAQEKQPTIERLDEHEDQELHNSDKFKLYPKVSHSTF